MVEIGQLRTQLLLGVLVAIGGVFGCASRVIDPSGSSSGTGSDGDPSPSPDPSPPDPPAPDPDPPSPDPPDLPPPDPPLDVGGDPPPVPPPCPPGDPDCLFWEPGVLQDVPIEALRGWKPCYEDTYAGSGITPLDVLQVCDGPALLIACGPRDEGMLELAAMGLRGDVTFDCGHDEDCMHEANGVGWYFSVDWSWGFAPPGEPLQRFECDVEETQGHLRLCWHTADGTMMWGYRCGNVYPEGSYARYVFHGG